MRQFFYWIYNPTTKLTKVGITDNYDRRFSQIENGCGCGIIPVGILVSDYADKLESLTLSVLSKHKTKGEWFSLSIEDLELDWLLNLFKTFQPLLKEDIALDMQDFITSYTEYGRGI